MSGIDWSKAPKGATHWEPDGDFSEGWMKWDGEQWKYFGHSQMNWIYSPICCDVSKDRAARFIERPSSPAWSGPQDGLPTAGCMVRIVDNGSLRYGVGEEGPVVDHVEDCAVVRMSYGLGCFEASVLAPALTPEQKAADQKEADSRSFIKTIMSAASLTSQSNWENVVDECSKLYFVQKKEQPK